MQDIAYNLLHAIFNMQHITNMHDLQPNVSLDLISAKKLVAYANYYSRFTIKDNTNLGAMQNLLALYFRILTK
jgi:hypothetical protein